MPMVGLFFFMSVVNTLIDRCGTSFLHQACQSPRDERRASIIAALAQG